VVCTYPTGESAFTSWPYQLGMVAVSLIAGISLLRPDPLRLRGRIPFVGPEPAATR
jgi:alpha-1,6-mannosyltransferase